MAGSAAVAMSVAAVAQRAEQQRQEERTDMGRATAAWQTKTIDQQTAKKLVQQLNEHGTPLTEAIQKAQRETNNLPIEAQALFVNDQEFQKIKGTEGAAGQPGKRTETDPNRPGAERPGQTGATFGATQKLAVEILCAGDRNLELVTFIPESNEFLRSGTLPEFTRGADAGMRRSDLEGLDGQRETEGITATDRTGQRRESLTQRDADRPTEARAQTGAFVRATEIAKAENIIGADVVNPQGAELGEIEDLAIDRQRGRIAYAVVAHGGFLGMGEKLIAVPWHALQKKSDDEYVLNVSKDELAKAPGFDEDNWPDMAEDRWARDVHAFYKVHMYFDVEPSPTQAEELGFDPGELRTSGDQPGQARLASDRMGAGAYGDIGRKISSRDAMSVRQTFQRHNFTLEKAVSQAKNKTQCDAFAVCPKFVSANDVQKFNRGEATGQQPGQRTPPGQERNQPGMQGQTGDKIMVQVACIAKGGPAPADAAGGEAIKLVMVDPETGDVVHVQNANQVKLDPFFTQVAGAARP